MQTLRPLDEPPVGQPAEAQPLPAHWAWVPWAVAAAFGAGVFVLVGITGSLRQRAGELTQQLGEAQQALADLQVEQTLLQGKLGKTETNYGNRIAELQRQIVQKNQEVQRQKTELETRLDSTRNEMARAQKQLAVWRTQAAQNAAELDRLNEALDGTTLPSPTQLSQLRLGILKPTADGPPNAGGAAAWDIAEQRGVLTIEGLPPLPPDRDYQIWLVDSSVMAPISGGVFRTDQRGNARTEFRAAGTVRSADRFAVSVERKGGTILPQGRFVLATN